MPTMTVNVKRIWSCQKRSLDSALGTLYAATGQREQARAELSTAIEMYRVMDMTFWLPQTEAALAQVDTR
jgi:hypothetical protein